MRRRAALPARLALVAFALAFGLAQLLLYADRNVFDSERFADRAVALLDDEDVRALAATRLTQAALDAKPDLIAVEPVLLGVADGVVGSSAFRSLVRSGLREAHTAVFSGRQDALVLKLSDGVLLLVQALEQLQPEIAREIPADVSVTLASVSGAPAEGPLVDASQLAEDVELLGWLLLGVAAVLLALAIALAPDRRLAVRDAGAAVAAVGGLLVVLIVVAGGIVEGRAPDEARDAVPAIWSGFFGDLLTFEVSLIAAGLVVAAVAASMVRPVGVGERLASLARAVTVKPERARVRAARAAALAAVGLAVLLEPSGALRLAAIAAGIVLLVLGVEELLALTSREQPRERARPALRPRRLALAAGLGLAALAAPAAVVAWTDELEQPPGSQACNGAIELCAKRIDEVALAATHNSMASPDAGFLFPNQDSGIAAQLDGGIRALLIDTHMGIPVPDGVFTVLAEGGKSREKIATAVGREATRTAERLRDRRGRPTGEPETWLCHGFCELGATDAAEALHEIREFLAANPREVLVIAIEDQISPQETVRIFERSGLIDRVWTGPIEPMPTLGEMIARDERVLVFGEEDTGSVPWYHLLFESAVETPFDVPTPARLLRPESCQAGRGERGAPIVLLNQFVARTPPRLTDAKEVNRRDAVVAHSRDCEQALGGPANLIAVDFWEQGDVVEAAAELNRLAPAGP